ncbi:MAG: hypothetical protein ABI467_21250 [Kofleriaceae bacterium]
MSVRPGASCAFVVALALGAAGGACVGRTQPYRFTSPLLGGADVPPAFSGRPGDPDARFRRPAADETITVQNGLHPSPRTPVEDPRPGAIRIASAQAAAGVATGLDWMRLPAAHAVPVDAPHAPASWSVHEPSELRALVGHRDSRDSVTAALEWSAELGAPAGLDLPAAAVPAHVAHLSGRLRAAAVIAAALANTAAVLAWARDRDRASDEIEPGSLLVFARTESDDAPDLVAIAIGRDARGVTEFIYCAGGAIRRGFMDRAHAAHRRDAGGAIENTFLRTGNRWPPKGTHYLAGELFVTAIRPR